MAKTDTARRYAILTEGWLADTHAKTAHGVIRYGGTKAVAIVDSRYAGLCLCDVVPSLHRDIPIVPSIEAAMKFSPTSLLIGVANAGGHLPPEFRSTILAAIDLSLEIVSGLHEVLAIDAEFRKRAEVTKASFWDVRLPPENISVFSGSAYHVPQTVVLGVGSDSAIGKMTAMLELEAAAARSGAAAQFVATGQTGIMIAGSGIAVDRVISDFVSGAAEALVTNVRPGVKYTLVEGQGSIFNPAFAPVTFGLLFGSAPDALILCHKPSRKFIELFEAHGQAIPELSTLIACHEEILSHVKPARIVAIALNTSDLSKEDAELAVRQAQTETGVPTGDVLRGDSDRIWRAVVESTVKIRKDALVPTHRSGGR